MKAIRIIFLYVIISFSLGSWPIISPGQAADYPHVTESGFTTLPASTRAMGMGGSFVAVADDYGASTFNPAGLVQLAQKEVGTMYSDLYGLGLLAYNFLFWVVPPTIMGAGGISWAHLSSNLEPERWDYDMFSYSYGQFTSPSKSPSPRVISSWGVNLKYLKQTSPWGASSGYSIDLAYFMRKEKVSWGINVQDSVSVRQWSTGRREAIPMNVKIGTSYRFSPDLLVALDVDISGKDLLKDARLGGEWWITPSFALRGGMSTLFQKDSFLTLSGGIGFNFPLKDVRKKGGVEFDYAFAYNQTLGNTHQFSLSLNF
jgi:hypothetical protein